MLHIARGQWKDEPLEYARKLADAVSLWSFVTDEVVSKRPAVIATGLPKKEEENDAAAAGGGGSPFIEPCNLADNKVAQSRVHEFIYTFTAFESFMLFGVMICFQSMLYDVTVTPIRAIFAAGYLTKRLLERTVGAILNPRPVLGALRSIISVVAETLVARLPQLRKRTEEPHLHHSRRESRTRASADVEVQPLLTPVGGPDAIAAQHHSAAARTSLRRMATSRSLKLAIANRAEKSKPGSPRRMKEEPAGSTETVQPERIHLCRGGSQGMSSGWLAALVDFAIVAAVMCIYRLNFDVSTTYHFIRGQSLLKLYVMFNMLEIVERLWRSLERDVLDDLRSRVDAFYAENGDRSRQFRHSGPRSKRESQSGAEISGTFKKKSYSFSLVLLWHHPLMIILRRYVMSVGCVCFHTAMHLLRGMLLCISMNSPESAMFLLLVSNNFAEVKSTVFKKQTPMSLWQLSAGDVVERFQICCDALFVGLQTRGLPRGSPTDGQVLRWMGMMMTVEILVDYVKHGFLIKFNQLNSRVFEQFRQVAMIDVLVGHAPAAAQFLVASIPHSASAAPQRGMTVFAHISANRLGFLTLPFLCFLTCLLPRHIFPSDVIGWLTLALFWIFLLLVMICLSFITFHLAVKQRTPGLDPVLMTLAAL